MKNIKSATIVVLLSITIAHAQAGILATLLVGGAVAGGGAAILSAKKHIDCTDPDQQTAHPYICKAKAKMAAEKEKLAAAKAQKSASSAQAASGIQAK